MDEINTRVRRCVEASIADTGRMSGLTDDTHLFEEAVLDSVGTVQLITALEQEFDIKLEDEDVFSPRFSTMRNIAELIAEHTHA